MAIEIAVADKSMIRAVLDNLRALDRRELEAVGSNIDLLPYQITKHQIFSFCAWDYVHGPVAAWGMISPRKGVGAGFAFGTDRWGSALLPMVRQIRGFVLPYLAANGFHRVEALALAHRRDIARFMELIGAQPEAVLRGYGISGEDFISYRWLADEYAPAQLTHAHAAH